MTQVNKIQRIRNGDRAAFRSFVTVTADKGYFLAVKILGDADKAQDVLQDAYVKMWEKRASLHENKDAYPWLSKVIVNKCYDILRKDRKITSVDEFNDSALQNESTDLSHQLDTLEMAEVIRKLTAGLPPKQKVVFILGEIEGFSNSEIHDATGISMNSVKTNLMLARKKIQHLAKQYYAEAKS